MPRAARLRPTRRTRHLTFPTIEVVGGLLSPDLVAKIAEPASDAATRKAYGIPDGLVLRDEIARAFRMAEAQWSRFDEGHKANPALALTFVPELLKSVFGFADLSPVPPVRLGERVFAIGHAAGGGSVPVVVAPAVDPGRQRTGLDVLHDTFADGGRRRSATQLLQEYLNADDACLWGIATDGRVLRLMRDNLSLTRPAHIDVDLIKLFREGPYADFCALWLLIHRSRFGLDKSSPSDCPLERWREKGKQEGVAARENLRAGVEAALALLGQGAIEHRDNAALREALASGGLSPQGFYEELLGTVYRLIFLFAAEDRNLLHPPGTPDAARAYAAGYAVGRLRERALHRASWNRHHDAWDGVRALFRALIHGAPAVGLPGLGGLFDPGRTPNLDGVRIGNRPLMEAIFRLAWIRPPGQSLARVNWRDMQTEELGSVYEGLLELIPEVNVEARTFGFRDISGAAGSERKSSGSYYTPDALVRLVLDKTLDPLLDQAAARPDPVEAILNLTVLDPACGSGHFLLGAARRIAGRIVALEDPAAAGAASTDAFQHALRQVVSRCIYGVDRNSLAVELCKVALWIEALEPGRPLSFLDHRIVCGDSLIGVFDLADLRRGVPDAAYDALTGDDKEAAKLYRKWNKEQRDGQGATGLLPALRPPEELIEEARAAATLPEDTVDAVAAKALAFRKLVTGEGWRRRKYACDLFVAAFFAKKAPLADAATAKEGERLALVRPAVPLTGHVWAAARGEQVYPPLIAEADRLAFALRCLHWPLAFPAEMARGGFDVVIGNPPWEVSQFKDQEFFASRDPEIAALEGERRKDAIKALPKTNPGTWARYSAERRSLECANEFYRECSRFELTAKGKLNTYALFAETLALLIGERGRAGVLVPTGIATDSSTSAFFGHLIERGRLLALIDFENRDRIFRDVYFRVRFCVLVIGQAQEASFACLLTNPAQLRDVHRNFKLTPEQIARLNPNTKTAPIFRTRADADLTAKIYDRVPVLIEEADPETGKEEKNPWSLTFQQGLFNMTAASNLFRAADRLAADGWQRDGTDWMNGGEERYVPLYEGKMIHHFNHRYGDFKHAVQKDDADYREIPQADAKTLSDPSYEPTPRYWVPDTEVRLRAARVSPALKGAGRAEAPVKALKALAEHVSAAWPAVHGRSAREADLFAVLGRNQPWLEALGATPGLWLRKPATSKAWPDLQRKTPLDAEDLLALADAEPEALAQAACLIDRKQPRWLMGWRDITNATNERTVIATVFPKVGVNHKLPICCAAVSPALVAALVASWTSLTFDYCARQKVGATSLTYFYMKQFPCILPGSLSIDDLHFIAPRVLELTYTSHAMRPWAEDLGHTGPPFGWDEEWRASLRAELDGFFARKYGLTRDELRYVLDPADVHGPDFPSETFRVLRGRELARYGEYRTRRLVLDAYDRLEGVT